jgi:hypothetical protein
MRPILIQILIAAVALAVLGAVVYRARTGEVTAAPEVTSEATQTPTLTHEPILPPSPRTGEPLRPILPDRSTEADRDDAEPLEAEAGEPGEVDPASVRLQISEEALLHAPAPLQLPRARDGE